MVLIVNISCIFWNNDFYFTRTFQHGLGDSSSDSLKPIFKQPLHWLSCISHFYPSLLRWGPVKTIPSMVLWFLWHLIETLIHGGKYILQKELKTFDTTQVSKECMSFLSPRSQDTGLTIMAPNIALLKW